MRIKHLFTAVAAMAIAASVATAQHNTPFSPLEYEGDAQPFEPFDGSTYGDPWPPRQGWFFSFERLVYFMNAPRKTDIGRDGLQAQVVAGNGFRTQTNTYNTGGLLTADDAWGNRYEFGFMDGTSGWLLAVFDGQPQDQQFTVNDMDVVFVDPPTGPFGLGHLDGFVIRSNLSSVDDNLGEEFGLGDPTIFGRFFDGDGDGVIDPTNIADNLDPSQYDLEDTFRLPVLFQEAHIRNLAYMDGVELMKTNILWQMHHGGMLEVHYGVRYMRLRDRFRVRGFGGILGDSEWHNLADNNLVGPQVGARWYRRNHRWTLSAEGRFLAGFNFQSTQLTGFLGSQLAPVTDVPDGATGLPPLNGGLNTTSRAANTPAYFDPNSFAESWHQTEWAPTGELKLNASYNLTGQIALRAGYQGLYTYGVTRASNTIDYVMPAMGIRRDNNRQSLWTNMVTFGFEWNR